jgi:NAD-dependent SIR2 family protein deacetylase
MPVVDPDPHAASSSPPRVAAATSAAHQAPAASPLSRLGDVLRGRKIVVLTGAGCSTESGIPDYRGPETRRTERNPIRYRAFVSDARARQHYWARSAIGWPTFAAATPNAGHSALAHLEAVGRVRGVITQNVDGLHQDAGSVRVTELHGALDEVRCLRCGRIEARDRLQTRLLEANPGWTDHAAAVAPDGDADLGPGATDAFAVPACTSCGGVLKPNVVFFGESVPEASVAEAWALMDEAEALLVAGSSLAVFSGFRFVRWAAAEGLPIGIVNLGPTRGDDLATVRVNGRTGAVLPRLVRALS